MALFALILGVADQVEKYADDVRWQGRNPDFSSP